MRKFIPTILVIILIIIFFYLYLVLASQKKYDVEYGISFNRQHAEVLGLEWEEVYLAMFRDLQPKYIRIAATWRETEIVRNDYDFSAIDWQMDIAEKFGAKVVLVVGQKAPRWPECHVPVWANHLEDEDYKKELFSYVKKVVNRYKDHTALELWQVENEPFIKFRFGDCENFHENLVTEEIKFVKDLDSKHKVIITDSGELSTWWKASRAGDLFGNTLYRIVRLPSGRIWTYDWLPASFYRFKATVVGKNIKDVFVSELQAEPWFTDGNVYTTPIDEQMLTMSPKRLLNHFDYVERIGVSRAYLWGVEWWYWMKEKANDATYWGIVMSKINK